MPKNQPPPSLFILFLSLCLSFLSNTFADKSTLIFVEGNNQFAINLYQQLGEKEGNLFFSPYSISTALAMTYAGARENTAQEMKSTLQFKISDKLLHLRFSEFADTLNTIGQQGSVKLNVANALWPQAKYTFLPEYLKLIEEHHNAALFPLDYKADAEKSRLKINDWVETQTNQKIKDLIAPGILDASTRLVLTNAIYFKGNWSSQFKSKKTKEAPFWVSTGQSIPVPMMFQKQKFKYMENNLFQMIELPYEGKRLSMILLLPKKAENLSEFESNLNATKLRKWSERCAKKEVDVFLPKFKLKTKFKLNKTLAKLGINDAFSAKEANFSGMDGSKSLYISKVIHQAFVEVNEEGTKAAASTAVAMTKSPSIEKPTIFRADHPFIFLIQDNEYGSILFMGRMANPTS